MTNRSKWLIASPFVFLIAFVVPAIVAGEWLWFVGDWAGTLFVWLTAGMWIVATAFVDVNRPRSPRERTDSLISLALILAVPASVGDRLYGPARDLPSWLSIVGIIASIAAIVLGTSARFMLANAYQPRTATQAGIQLVCSGPYRYIRHPMYSAALLWAIGWPLIIASVIGATITISILFPTLIARINREESELRKEFGLIYTSYCIHSWRLVPLLY